MEKEEKDITKILKWAGIVALIALPVIILLKNKSESKEPPDSLDGYLSEFE